MIILLTNLSSQLQIRVLKLKISFARRLTIFPKIRSHTPGHLPGPVGPKATPNEYLGKGAAQTPIESCLFCIVKKKKKEMAPPLWSICIFPKKKFSLTPGFESALRDFRQAALRSSAVSFTYRVHRGQ